MTSLKCLFNFYYFGVCIYVWYICVGRPEDDTEYLSWLISTLYTEAGIHLSTELIDPLV